MTGISAVLQSALNGMRGRPPADLLRAVAFYAEQDGLGPVDEPEVVRALTTDDVNSPARVEFQLLISRGDGAEGETWVGETAAFSAERRALIYERLGLADGAREEFDAAFPRDPAIVVIESAEGHWEPWYTAHRAAQHDFYWKAYAGVLAASPGWNASAIGRLDAAATAVVRRLADPTWPDRYQSKGLVVGYVQSGKTANFTGVLAKSIDAGYRLIIVLTGTVELLRRQTQRRLDMELIGVENILGGIDENDAARVATTDYHADKDWIDRKFLRHGVPIYTLDDIPTIRRLSTFDGDYKRLKQGLSTLDFRAGHELADRSRPLYDPLNVFHSDVRIAVVKKNSTVLKRLVDDLGEIHARLDEIPTLIIDDEADQASVNTKRQKNPSAEDKERTAINRRLSELLQVLGRAQYVGYTATPFANVFIDPDDSQDIFPKDFIVSLDRPSGYMGAREFHDLDADFDTDGAGQVRTVDNSNEKRYVRDLYANDDPVRRRREMQQALDSFVLSGALKLFRRRPTGLRFRHHTMLVHESVRTAEHAVLADEIRELWRRSAYDTPAGLARLRRLYDDDFAPVSAAIARGDAARIGRSRSAGADGGRADPLPMPTDFDELVSAGFVAKALDYIDRGTSPVIVVNGAAEKDYVQDSLDFQTGDVWKILVGGTKLSRGFTVEGLTISYYTRRTQQADTLMQMGRWFGFRRGYRDLVRLFIGRNVPAPGGRHIDLYDAFEAMVRDEEDFRDELRRYSAINQETGHPQICPEDVPPMVFQQLPWLKPTAANKMYNAELTTKGEGGKLVDFARQPDRGDGATNAAHFEAVRPLLDALDRSGEFAYRDANGAPRRFTARYGLANARLVRDVVGQFHWAQPWWFAPYLTFVENAMREGTLADFAILLPLLSDIVHRPVGDRPGDLPILQRSRRSDRDGFSVSSRWQRAAIETIAGKRQGGGSDVIDADGGPLAMTLHTPTRAGLLLSFALDTGEPSADPKSLPAGPVDPRDVATLFSWAMPYDSAPSGRVGFKSRKSGAGAIIDNDS